MTEKITAYIKGQTCATICCVDEMNKPYCFNCFYALNAVDGMLYFKSAADTQHAVLLKKKPAIAGSILPDQLKALHVKGIQFEGLLLAADHPLAKEASTKYYQQHPMALAIPGEIWTIQINTIKMTDSSLGFGKKINWSRPVITISGK